VKILDAAEEEGKLVVSQRLALSAASPALPRGTLVCGTVTGLRPYGVFLELEGGHSGLLHISQISTDRIENLAVHFAAGDKLKVVVLDHDKASGRVALSTKPLEPAAGDMLRNKAEVFAQAEETLRR
jgi:small subunit ribosomal protein S1